jgi:hypothetical protein
MKSVTSDDYLLGRCTRAIVVMVEAVSTSETSVSLHQTTRRNIQEDSHLQTCRREKLKSHQIYEVFTEQS